MTATSNPHRIAPKWAPILAILFSSIIFPACSHAQSKSQPVRDRQVEAQLVSSRSAIQPGKPFTIGLKFEIDDHWHTYWSNPGNTGKPTNLKLTLPEGFTAGPLLFPVPKRFVVDFGYNIIEAGFGYEKSVVHTIVVTPPADLAPGTPVTIAAKADWLMCNDKECVPGKAELSISLPVAEFEIPSASTGLVEISHANVPGFVDWVTAAISLDSETVTVAVTIPEDKIPAGAKTHLYPDTNYIFEQLSVPEIKKDGGNVTFTFKKDPTLEAAPKVFSGIFVIETASGKTGYRVSTDPGAANKANAGSLTEANPDSSTNQADLAAAAADEIPFGGGLFGVLLAAFLGGMLLNIMPCVFPVISLKVLSFVGQAGEDRKKVFYHAIAFTVGILVFFLLLAVALVSLRAVSGEAVNWGAQLQQPLFVLGLVIIMVLVALSLFGVFEIGSSLTMVGGDLANKSGYSGSFWSGALAVLLATPCTAPLMAPAITFALVQPAIITIIVLLALGLGMAAPYFVFAIFPKLLDVIPPPGAWMETFKQFMGFPMLAVAVWLIGVLSAQLNVQGLQWSLAAALLVAFAAWILGRYAGFDKSQSTRMKGRIAALLVFVLALFVGFKTNSLRKAPNSTDIRDVIAGHRDEGKHVFVDFTAEWCATCKANERISVKTEKTQAAFKENGVEFVIADWTNHDPNISALLKEHGRSGVPAYILFPADKSKPAIKLKDGIITHSDIMEAVDQLD